ncbi:hypothetical protein FKM82_021222 [Ascaphus truei]
MMLRSKVFNRTTECGTRPCQDARCKTCAMLHTIHIPHKNREYKIRGRFTCSSSNVVYLIVCMKCPGGCYYIGETGRGLNKRMNLHHHSITRGIRDNPV